MGSVQRVDRTKPWLARYRGPDGRQHSRSFARKFEAQQWLRAEESRVDRDEWIDPKAANILFARQAEAWFEGTVLLKPSTVNGYRWHLASRVLPTFGDKQLRSIKPQMIRGWQNGLLARGLSAGTVRQSRQVLSLVLSQAVNDGLLAENPSKRVEAPTVRPRRQLILNQDQLHDLACACEAGEDKQYGALVLFLGWCGPRFSEAVALRASRVEPRLRRIKIEEGAVEVSGRHYFGTPKSGEGRTVVAPSFVMDRINLLLDRRAPDDFVFTSPRGFILRSNNFRRRVFAPAAEKIGIPDLLPHDLRDTAASLAISSGASIKAVQRMLGHSSAQVTLDIYGSLFEEDLDKLADALEERYRSKAQTEAPSLEVRYQPASISASATSSSRNRSMSDAR